MLEAAHTAAQGPCDQGHPSGRHIPWQDLDTAEGGLRGSGAMPAAFLVTRGHCPEVFPGREETEPQAGWHQTPGLPEPLLRVLIVGSTFPPRLSSIWGSQSWE